MTPAEIIYQRRIAVLEHAQRTGNVAEPCRVFSISRTRYYQWKNVADRYGLDALMPKARRAPQMPDATPTHVIEALLTLAVLEPHERRFILQSAMFPDLEHGLLRAAERNDGAAGRVTSVQSPHPG